MRYVVIMAGGSGTRLWPLSRQGTPKQLLPLIEGKSLLRLAFERSLASVPRRAGVGGDRRDVRRRVAAQLPELPAANILGEPVGRDSLNAVAWPAAVLHPARPGRGHRPGVRRSGDRARGRLRALRRHGVRRRGSRPPTCWSPWVWCPPARTPATAYLHRGDALPGFEGAHRVLDFAEKPALDVAQATWRPATTGGTRACSSGGRPRCSSSCGCCCPPPTRPSSSWLSTPTGWLPSSPDSPRPRSTTA